MLQNNTKNIFVTYPHNLLVKITSFRLELFGTYFRVKVGLMHKREKDIRE